MPFIAYQYRLTGEATGVHEGICAHCGHNGIMVAYGVAIILYFVIDIRTVDALKCANCGQHSAKQTRMWRYAALFGILFMSLVAIGLAVGGYALFQVEARELHPAFLPVCGSVLVLLALGVARKVHDSWRRWRNADSLVPHEIL